MGTDTILAGHIDDGLGMIVNVISVHPPFQVGVGIHSQEYIVDTDFTSGNDVLFSIEGTDKIRMAVFTTEDGTIITYTEAALASGTGIGLTLAAVTVDFKAFIIFDT